MHARTHSGGVGAKNRSDSYVLAVSDGNLLALENENLPRAVRASMRKKLFGEAIASLAYSTNPDKVAGWRRFLSRHTKSGTLKVEKANFKSGVFLALKVYCLSDSRTDGDTSKFKALSTKTELDPDLYARLDSDPGVDLVERRMNLRAMGGIHVTETCRRATSIQSRMQLKFQTVAPNETRAFD